MKRSRTNWSWCRARPKDPFPAWSHWAGAVLAVVGSVALLAAGVKPPLQLVALAVYGVSLVLLYIASAVAHSVRCEPRLAQRLDRLDYAAIFVVIAGTYTPFCVITLRGPWGWTMLACVWAAAALGITLVYAGNPTRHWPRVLIYVVMGWLVVAAAGPLARALPPAAMAWLAAGGVVYTAGAAVYMTGRPRLWPGRFGSHDLWHCMVLVGSACHFLVIAQYVARA